MAASRLVCVTGANGLVASHCVKLLLDQGYRVRGTVRDVKQETKYKALKQLPHAATNLEIVQIPDITKAEGFPEAFKDCDYVLHVASPVNHGPDVVQTAIRGTLNACEAALAAGVKRIVITASLASICGSQRDKDPNHVWSEKDWNDAPGSDYAKSKTLAEKAAWDFVAAHPELELTTIHPALVLGPCLSPDMITSSLSLGYDLASGKKKGGIEGLNKFGICHSYDVAEAHVKAMHDPKAKGQRYLVSSVEQWSPLKVAQVMKEKWPSLETPTTEAQPVTLMAVSNDPSKVIEFLGRPLKTAKETIIEMTQSFIDLGLIKVD